MLDELPIADALPVVIVADPLLPLAAWPLLTAPPVPPPAFWLAVAPLFDELPMAMLPPVLATAAPVFDTLACWLMTWIVPRLPETVTVWVLLVPDWLPTALASPEWAAPVPAESVPAWAASCA